MRRETHFDFSRRESLKGYYIYGPDQIEGLDVPWTSEIVSCDGAQYHCWVDPDLTPEQQEDLKKHFRAAASWKGDPVSFSWDFIPKEGP